MLDIRIANISDLRFLSKYDNHINEAELNIIVQNSRVLIAEINKKPVGWLRWNLFWDNTPFMNMLYLLEDYRGNGYGGKLVFEWESILKQQGYFSVLTSSLSNESAQHFYRKSNYKDCGSLLIEDEPLEIIFSKKLMP